MKSRPFIPDFSLRVCENVQILRIRRAYWLAAIRATFFENKQKENGERPMLNSNGEKIDLLTQELEKANCIDQLGTTPRISSERKGQFRDRAMSLTPAIDSKCVKKVQECFVNRPRSKSSSQNAKKNQSRSSTISSQDTSS